MFKAIKDNKIIALNDTGVFPCLNYETAEEDKEHSIEDYVMVGEEFVLSTDAKAIDKKKENVRLIRNEYLENTDKFVSIPDFPINFETKDLYIEYRQYLRDYTELKDWYKQNPKTFEEFKGGD